MARDLGYVFGNEPTILVVDGDERYALNVLPRSHESGNARYRYEGNVEGLTRHSTCPTTATRMGAVVAELRMTAANPAPIALDTLQPPGQDRHESAWAIGCGCSALVATAARLLP